MWIIIFHWMQANQFIFADFFSITVHLNSASIINLDLKNFIFKAIEADLEALRYEIRHKHALYNYADQECLKSRTDFLWVDFFKIYIIREK